MKKVQLFTYIVRCSRNLLVGSVAFVFIACGHSSPAPEESPTQPVSAEAKTNTPKPRVVVHLANADEANRTENSSDTPEGSSVSSESCERIDINVATKEDLISLPGIGPTRATTIVSYRDKNGRFPTVDNLTDVPGIGNVTLEKLRPFLIAGADVAPTAPKSPESTSSDTTPSDLVNINIGTTDDLITLSGIGPTMAARIIAYREMHGPFLSKESLQEVKGIGPSTLEKLRSYFEVTVDINKASAEDFETLGFKNGAKIVQRRNKRGSFKSPSKLKSVPGTDKKLLERLRVILQ